MPEAALVLQEPATGDDAAVGANERVFRRVRYEKNEYTVTDGKVVLSSQAFSESTGKPSVDREILRGGSPIPTQGKDGRNAVVRLTVLEVREMDRIYKLDAKQRPVGEGHAFDVFPDPLAATDTEPENPAHAEIRPVPEFADMDVKALRRRLQHALARIVNETKVADIAFRWPIAVYELRAAPPSDASTGDVG
jgi:hypothetical protein